MTVLDYILIMTEVKLRFEPTRPVLDVTFIQGDASDNEMEFLIKQAISTLATGRFEARGFKQATLKTGLDAMEIEYEDGSKRLYPLMTSEAVLLEENDPDVPSR